MSDCNKSPWGEIGTYSVTHQPNVNELEGVWLFQIRSNSHARYLILSWKNRQCEADFSKHSIMWDTAICIFMHIILRWSCQNCVLQFSDFPVFEGPEPLFCSDESWLLPGVFEAEMTPMSGCCCWNRVKSKPWAWYWHCFTPCVFHDFILLFPSAPSPKKKTALRHRCCVSLHFSSFLGALFQFISWLVFSLFLNSPSWL